MRKNIFVMLAVAAMMVACQGGENVPMFFKLPAIPFSVEGTHADLVKGASTEWFFFRDSVANEETDTVYNVTVDAKLRVEKAFEAEKIDTLPQLKFFSQSGEELVVMDVKDSSVIKDFVSFYLKDKVGAEREIRFVGKMNKSKFLKLPETKQAVLIGFSLYDPEAHADPAITKMIDEYLDFYNNAKELLEDGMPVASTPMMRLFGNIEDHEAKLKAKEKAMTKAQMERYKGIASDLQKLVNKYDN